MIEVYKEVNQSLCVFKVLLTVRPTDLAFKMLFSTLHNGFGCRPSPYPATAGSFIQSARWESFSKFKDTSRFRCKLYMI